MTSSVPVKAVRGAITVDENSAEAIHSATSELLKELLSGNNLAPGDIISIIFTATEDLTAIFPARAARDMGLAGIPLLCCRELTIEGMLPMCIRILAHTWMPDRDATHIYLRNAVSLREDLAANHQPCR